jgi:4a-hydroxytetrahydrobiopterin dehydratase
VRDKLDRRERCPIAVIRSGARPRFDAAGEDDMADRLDDAAISDALADLVGWAREGDTIVRNFEFADFVDAVGFIAKVGVLAERRDHHPELNNVYNKVRVALSTHDAGGVTDLDVSLAGEINERA